MISASSGSARAVKGVISKGPFCVVRGHGFAILDTFLVLDYQSAMQAVELGSGERLDQLYGGIGKTGIIGITYAKGMTAGGMKQAEESEHVHIVGFKSSVTDIRCTSNRRIPSTHSSCPRSRMRPSGFFPDCLLSFGEREVEWEG